jgi:hypothetical protein
MGTLRELLRQAIVAWVEASEANKQAASSTPPQSPAAPPPPTQPQPPPTQARNPAMTGDAWRMALGPPPPGPSFASDLAKSLEELEQHFPAESSDSRRQDAPRPARPMQDDVTIKERRCSTCSGSGLVTCSSCSGHGYFDRYTQHNRGDGGVELLKDRESCASCSGGQRPCSTCKGTGQVMAFF